MRCSAAFPAAAIASTKRSASSGFARFQEISSEPSRFGAAHVDAGVRQQHLERHRVEGEIAPLDRRQAELAQRAVERSLARQPGQEEGLAQVARLARRLVLLHDAHAQPIAREPHGRSEARERRAEHEHVPAPRTQARALRQRTGHQATPAASSKSNGSASSGFRSTTPIR